ncbi:hypothetical protein KQI30_16680 [Clostridium bornimense]|uniref:hypothetical protein n=1 Tax=Clostridium bornimense TaxID=1216932 RepID=UPI001C1293CE|nr:hypothetical protein [Clostridium bornimense]MBU5317881.1 hypothetical protein [Clostridium bornimense]
MLKQNEKEYFRSAVMQDMVKPIDSENKTVLATKPCFTDEDYVFLCNIEDIIIKNNKIYIKKSHERT